MRHTGKSPLFNNLRGRASSPPDQKPLDVAKARSRRRVRWLVLLALLCLPLLSNCAPFVDSAQPVGEPTLLVADTVGQTFVSRHDGLSGLDVALGPMAEAVTLTLRTGPRGEVVASAQAQPSQGEQWTRFTFPPLNQAHNRRFYLELSASGPVAVSPGPADAYREGALYVDGEAQEAQLSFRLVYDPLHVGWGLVLWVVGGLLPGLVILGLLLLPGAALLAWPQSPPERRQGGLWGQAVLAATLSLALLPLLMQAFKLLGLRLGPAAAWGLLFVSALALLAHLFLSRTRHQTDEEHSSRPRTPADWAWTVSALVIVGLVVGVRLLVLRSLEIPLWGDSVQHTTIVQLMLDQGGLFSSWQPYAPFQSFTIHYGFHAAAAFLAWLTGRGAPQAVLLSGQAWNILAVLALYPLTVRLAGSKRPARWAGLGAVLAAGLLSAMPMFYVNWGRYPQLAGLALLPGALVLLMQAVEDERWRLGSSLLAALALAGSFLAYYRLVFFYATLVAAWTLGGWLPRLGFHLRPWLAVAGRLATIGALAALLMLPRLLGLSGGYLGEAVKVTTAQGLESQAAQVLAGYREWQHISQYVPPGLLAVAGIGLLWSLVRRQWAVAAVGLWAIALVALNASQLLGLPGASMMTHFAVQISLYLPLSVLAGWLLADVAIRLDRGRLAWGLAALLVVLGLWGARDRLHTVNRYFEMVTQPDQAAMDWIADHTPPDAVFLVNGFSIYDGLSAVGSDAGWWLPLLAGRRNTMPPQYALFNERAEVPGYRESVVALVRQLEQQPLAVPESLAAVCDLGVTHLYVGQLQGQVGSPPPTPLFTAAELRASPDFELLYHQDRVWVFVLAQGVCAE